MGKSAIERPWLIGEVSINHPLVIGRVRGANMEPSGQAGHHAERRCAGLRCEAHGHPPGKSHEIFSGPASTPQMTKVDMIARRRFSTSCAALLTAHLPASALANTLVQHVEPAGLPAPLLVGPTRPVKTIAEAARRARAGTVIDVDAGEYIADVAVWEYDQVTVRAQGGRVRLLAQGAAAERKAIWVVRARGMRVKGFDFEGAAVPGRNGAGIRLEGGSLLVRDCRFLYNEMGLLTSNDPTVVLQVENSEFAHNMRPDGHNHNLYVGQIARLSVTGSYFHHARTGHLLKSRAAVNHVFYNRLTDEVGGTASYELEFPNGGVAYVVGNLVEQTAQTENPHLISFGAEGYTWPRNEIHLVNNTLVDQRPQGGVFLRVAPGADVIRAINNLLVGAGTLESAGPGEYRNNLTATPRDFAQPAVHDFRLRMDSRLAGRGVAPGDGNGQNLEPRREYIHPRDTRAVGGGTLNPGAMQSTAPATPP